MAQTADALSAANATVEFSADGTTWTDISGSTTSVEPGDQSVMSGVIYTFSGDTAIITAGKREPLDITVKIVYTETTGEAFEVVRTAFAASKKGFIRYAPKGAATGDAQYASTQGVITNFTYPGADAGDGKPVMAGFKIKVPSLTRAILA